MSDHEAVTFQLNASTKVKRKIFLFHKANLEGMKTKLQELRRTLLNLILLNKLSKKIGPYLNNTSLLQ